MYRTPLFRLVQRSLRLAHHSLHSERSVAEIADLARLPKPAVSGAGRLLEPGAKSLSRRRFVALSSTAATALAVDGCLPRRVASSVARQRPVVIVGAGIAGLTAGLRLRQAGMPVSIHEAQNRVGGRMYSLRDGMADGQVIELGGELIDTDHSAIRRLAAELGIPLDDLSLDDPSLTSDVWYFDGVRRSDGEVMEAFRPLALRIDTARATFPEDEITHDAPGGTGALDRQTLAGWLDEADIRGWLRKLIDVAYTTEYGLEPGDQSALNLLTMIGTDPDSFDIFGESDERFHVQGGNDRITTAVADRLDDAIHPGHVLEAVTRRADGTYRCTFRRGASTLDVDADQVILALPFTMLRQLRLDVELPAVKRRAIDELGYGTNAKLMVGFSERVWRTRHGANGSSLTDLPYQLTWETSRLQGGASGVLTNFTGGRHGMELGSGTPEAQAALMVGQLEQIFPGASAAHSGQRAVRFHWPTFPWTQGSYASYRPGQWTELRGAEGESVDRLHFAGEHCSLPAQGFMEGGCETGEAAARAVLAAAGMRSASRRDALRTLVGAA